MPVEHQTLIHTVNSNFGLTLAEEISMDRLLLALGLQINELIKKDFDKLVFTLYRVDVSEQKLKQVLQEHPGEDAGNLIARLLVERELQKIRSRQAFRNTDSKDDNAERW